MGEGLMAPSQHKLQNAKGWHWHPELPVALSPIFSWPPQPVATLKWIASYWFAISSVTILFVLAWGVFALLQPPLSEMRQFQPGWIAQIWARNICLTSVIAGGLHLWFYIIKAQGTERKYDPRPLARGNRKFWFSDQVWDNMFFTLVSGVTIWTGFEVSYFWAAAHQMVPLMVWQDNPLWFAGFFVLIPIWSSLHFYLIHRALHWQPLYKLAHNLHHRNINIGPWSGISMHPIEHVMYFSSCLIHFILPSHPLHLLFHLYLQGMHPAFSHSGYDGVISRGRKQLQTGDFFHQLHHRYVNCNYGTVEMPWDKLFGTFHDGHLPNRQSSDQAAR